MQGAPADRCEEFNGFVEYCVVKRGSHGVFPRKSNCGPHERNVPYGRECVRQEEHYEKLPDGDGVAEHEHDYELTYQFRAFGMLVAHSVPPAQPCAVDALEKREECVLGQRLYFALNFFGGKHSRMRLFLGGNCLLRYGSIGFVCHFLFSFFCRVLVTQVICGGCRTVFIIPFYPRPASAAVNFVFPFGLTVRAPRWTYCLRPVCAVSWRLCVLPLFYRWKADAAP